MTSQHLRAACLVAAALVLIAGCRNTDRADAATPSTAPPALIARGQVDTERGTLSIGLPIDGTIADVAVTEGMTVSRGQRLLDTDATPARLDAQLAEAKLTQAIAQTQLLVPKVEAANVRSTRLAQAARDGAGDRQSADEDELGRLGVVVALDRSNHSRLACAARLQAPRPRAAGAPRTRRARRTIVARRLSAVAQRDRIFHRELGARADREVRGVRGVAQQHDVAGVPLPQRTVGKLRQIERFLIRRWPCSSSAKSCSQIRDRRSPRRPRRARGAATCPRGTRR